MSHTVICTAGHIDHGKTSLIYALTGYNPDRLKEEQEREMTTDLGFAFYGDRVTFIDVPGHEKFLKTMLAGASGVDGSVLVIAADDGVMPQTREHFEILQLLGITKGIIALTKIDMVESDWVDMVSVEIREMVGGSFLQDAPILPLSNRTGAGMTEFKAALDELIALAETRRDRGLFRMWVDRAFTLKGSGTVVAGTVLSGSVKVGDRVEILPAGLEARVKRIQVHKTDVPAAGIGERAALNLPGIDKDAVQRGQLLATPDHYRPTYMLNARLNLLPSVAKPLASRTRIRLHLGSSEHIGRVILLECHPIPPGGSAFVQFHLEDQAMADIGDRYVIRSFSEGRVIGGGMALDIHPPKMKQVSEEEIQRLRRRESAEPRELLRQFITAAAEKTTDAESAARELALPLDEVIDLIGALERDGEMTVLSAAPRWQVVNHVVYDQLKSAILMELTKFHHTLPHLRGGRQTDIKTKLMPDAPPLLLDKLLEDLSASGNIEMQADVVSLKGHQVSFNPELEVKREHIANLFLTKRFQPPDAGEVAETLNVPLKLVEPIITGLCELGVLLKLYDPDGKSVYYHRDAIAEAQETLLKFFKDHAEMRFFEFRELIGSTRKYTTPILMHFDDIGLTYRVGEVRKLR